MKKIFAGLIGLGAIGVMAGALLESPDSLSPKMDNFLAALRVGGPDKARVHLTADFAGRVTNRQLESFSKAVGLAGSVSASWSRELVADKEPYGQLYGSLTTKDGDVTRILPTRVTFVRESGGWKIQTIGVDAPGLVPSSSSTEVPKTEAMVEKVNTIFQLFDVSIKRGDMRPLWLAGSHVWRKQFPIEKLDQAYRPFLKRKVDFASLFKFGPVFDGPPKILENGVLEVRGHYPTKPDAVFFHQRFVYEGLDWALVGFAVEMRPDKPSS